MNQPKQMTRVEWGKLIVVIAVVVGAYMRFNPTMLAGFPINDGGMFAKMVDDLKTSHYALPAFTSYNGRFIPFAYPPLGFYFGRIASDIFGFDSVQALRWVPAFFASLSIFAFYLLALRLLKDQYLAALSTFFFAMMPRAMSWFIMGGGLTRSPGQFFMLLALASVVRLYQENRKQDIFLAGLFGGLAVMSHPEAAIFTFASGLFLWIMLSRNLRGFLQSMGVAALVLIVSSPWWLTVILNHRLAPLLSAAQTGSKILAWAHLVFFVFTEEPYATFIAIFGLIGLAHRLIHRDYLLPLWVALPFLVEGRSAPAPAAIPLAMLAAIGLSEVVLKAYQLSAKNEADVDHISAMERNVFLYLLLYFVFSTYQFGYQISKATLYPDDIDAMQWVSLDTPENSRFIVLTGTTSVSCDSVLEWFPALANRKSLFTVQGTEWTEGANFNAYVRSTYPVQECLSQDAACFMNAAKSVDYDYVYISKTLRVNNCAPLDMPRTYPYFLNSMKNNPNFERVYETDGVVIFKKNQ